MVRQVLLVPAFVSVLAAAGAQDLASWADREVPDIIEPTEREAFQKLRNDVEREQFIEAFWLRRDPTPGTAANEFRDEYFRRVALANQRFTTKSGTPGSQTDRGRVLIRYGEPSEIETHAQGGTSFRGAFRGTTFPFDRWRYRFLQGIGNNVILEFVDVAGDGSFQLTYDPSEAEKILPRRKTN